MLRRLTYVVCVRSSFMPHPIKWIHHNCLAHWRDSSCFRWWQTRLYEYSYPCLLVHWASHFSRFLPHLSRSAASRARSSAILRIMPTALQSGVREDPPAHNPCDAWDRQFKRCAVCGCAAVACGLSVCISPVTDATKFFLFYNPCRFLDIWHTFYVVKCLLQQTNVSLISVTSFFQIPKIYSWAKIPNALIIILRMTLEL